MGLMEPFGQRLSALGVHRYYRKDSHGRYFQRMVLIAFFSSIVGISHASRWSVNCPKPELKDGNIIPAKQEYASGESVNIACNDGYSLIGNDSLRCHNDGTWSGNRPYCEELRCPKLPSIHGLKQGKKPSIGGVIDFECEKGFVMIGDPTLNCTANGIWVPNIMPTCSIIACQRLPQIMNGSIEIEEPALIQTVANFSCYQGFVLVGPHILECGADGMWTPDMLPRCDEKDIIEAKQSADVLNILSIVSIIASAIVLVACLYKAAKLTIRKGCMTFKNNQMRMHVEQNKTPVSHWRSLSDSYYKGGTRPSNRASDLTSEDQGYESISSPHNEGGLESLEEMSKLSWTSFD